MPRLLTTYIVRHVLGMTVIVALAMLTIHSFVTLVTEADDTGKNGFGVLQLVQTTLLQIPSGLALLMPIVSMIGALMGLGVLAGQGELTAMRAAGFSVQRIAVATVMAGALLGGLHWFISDLLAPAGEHAAEVVRARARGSEVAVGTTVWLRDGDQVLRIRRLLAEDRAEGVEIYRLNQQFKLTQALSAERAHFQDDHWQLQGVKQTTIAANGRASVSKAAVGEWSGSVNPNVLRLFVLEADAISLGGLRRLIDYLDDNRLDASKYRMQMWRKLIEPFTVMAMALFAVPFVFGTLRDSGAGQRLLIGILLGVGFYVVNRVSLSLGQLYGWSPILAAGGPTLVWATLGCWRVSRIR